MKKRFLVMFTVLLIGTLFFSAFDEGPVSHDELRATIENISPDRFTDNNLKVFDAGLQRGRAKRGK